MRTMRRSQCLMESARFFLASILILSFFVQTQQQQREIKSKWDNRLLPTNSVYEKSREFSAPLGMENSRKIENSSSKENANNDEIYDDDYEIEDPNVNVDESVRKISRIESIEDHDEDKTRSEKKLSLETPRETSINHGVDDAYYYYYDDYENVTNPENDAPEREPVDYFDSSETVSPKTKVSEELISEKSKIAESLIEEISVNSTSESSTTSRLLNEELIGEKSEEIEQKVDNAENDDEILIGEAVVSVVTTKSVVNGTISVPSSPRPMTTEQIISSIIPASTENPGSILSNETIEESTEDSRIVASVQTSRSISGARFLPFLVVDSDSKIDPPNSTIIDEKSDAIEMPEVIDKNNEESMIEDEYKMMKSSFPVETTESMIEKVNDPQSELSLMKKSSLPVDTESSSLKKSPLPVESTESIIDKLDRVQSELSSGFLANGFRTSGNTLQLDVLSEQRPQINRKTFTTTSRTPVISKFIPRRYNQDKKTVTTTISSLKITETIADDEMTGSMEKVKFRWPSSSRNSRPSETDFVKNKNHNIRDFLENGTRKTTTTPRTSGLVNPDISAFLPPGYKFKKEDDEVTEKSLLGEILAKSKINISSLLPANYENVEKSRIHEKGEKNLADLFVKPNVDFASLLPVGYKPSDEQNSDSTRTTEKSIKGEKTLQDLFAKTSVDIADLLPPGYNKFKDREKIEKITSTATIMSSEALTLPMTLATTPKTSGGIKLVFPSRPGGRKALPKNTTPQRIEGGPVTPRIQKGWPTRATTEFTGWPTPSTTPISIEKLLEAARTATVASTNVSGGQTTETPTTTSTSTTTTTTPRPTTPGICEDECEVAGTIRIVGNASWVPELLDRNTQEWQQLAEEIEKEMNLVFVKSSVLRKWYKRIRIDAFSPGSILVDYFIELTDIPQRINTQELKVIFHDSLRTFNSDKWNETRAKGPIRLGTFAIDPKSTDFVVVPKVSYPQYVEADDRLIPQWAIAVIVIGVGGLLFIIVFGVSVLVNRQNAAKLKPGPVVYTEEVAKNIIQASHAAPSHRSSQDYPKSEISTIWNDNDAWREKSFESNSNEILVDGTLGRTRNPDRRGGERKYNMYDSWRSEWNGYYYNPSQSSKFAGYESTTNLSRHPPDYDTNF